MNSSPDHRKMLYLSLVASLLGKAMPGSNSLSIVQFCFVLERARLVAVRNGNLLRILFTRQKYWIGLACAAGFGSSRSEASRCLTLGWYGGGGSAFLGVDHGAPLHISCIRRSQL